MRVSDSPSGPPVVSPALQPLCLSDRPCQACSQSHSEARQCSPRSYVHCAGPLVCRLGVCLWLCASRWGVSSHSGTKGSRCARSPRSPRPFTSSYANAQRAVALAPSLSRWRPNRGIDSRHRCRLGCRHIGGTGGLIHKPRRHERRRHAEVQGGLARLTLGSPVPRSALVCVHLHLHCIARQARYS